MTKPQIVQCFTRNTSGRDFVVGDVHGCFDQLQAALEKVRFDPLVDRCFSVGDLIDRGPDSVAALTWLEQPWFHACLGNHEGMLLAALPDRGASFKMWVVWNGGDWWLNTDPATRTRFRDRLARLPLAMEIETAWGRVGIVHADVPCDMDWKEFTVSLEGDDSKTRDAALWSRSRAMGHITGPVPGIARIVCGHTIRADRRVYVMNNVWFIDTGAYREDGISSLTLLELSTLFDGAPPSSS